MKEHPFMAEVGESSGSQSSSQIWAKLVPLHAQQSDIEVCSEEMIVSSQITSSSQVKHDWCKITRNADMLTAMMQNKSSNDILVDDAVVRREDVVEIKCGTEMVLGPNREEYLSYIFKLMPSQETCKKKLKAIRSERGSRGKRGWAYDGDEYASEESDDVGTQCPQCGSAIGGFQCNQQTIHIQCQNCGGMMPSRADIDVPQHCSGCDRSFCGAYWHAQRVTRSEYHPVCNHETFRPISEHTITRIPFLAHEMNRHEQDITERCISQSGRTLQEVVAEWIRKLNNREIDRTRMPLNHAERITAATHVCSTCYEKLVSFLLYWFRISLPKYHLPSDASQREDCWYGYACRTQHHNEEHARKRNHVCRPTRGA